MEAMRARWSAGGAAPLVVLSVVLATSCGGRTAAQEPYPAFTAFAGREVERVSFVDPAPFTADTLALLVDHVQARGGGFGAGAGGLFSWIRGRRPKLDPRVLERDAARVALFYAQSGYFGTRVIPVVEPEEDAVAIAFLIARGDPVILTSLKIEGTEGIPAAERARWRLPLQEGDLFDLGDFAASADTLRRALLSEGHAYAEVLRNYTVDTVANAATASLVAVPGPRVVVDSILVFGAVNLGRKAALRQLTFRKGDLLVADELAESQRNLYALELVQFATVAVADDSLQVTPEDSSTATVAVRISEAPVHVVEAAVGFGTVECIRTEVRWVNRSFGGGARRLALTGTVTKIGIGEPLAIGGGSSICRAYRGDPFADELDYRVSADFTQPWFLSPRNHLALSAFAERLSEPRAYQREALGGRVAVSRRLADRELLTGLLDFERGRTLADPALFCVAFQVCLPSDIAALSSSRWRNTIGANWTRDRTVRVADPIGGYTLRAAGTWAAPWLGSDVRFVRGTAESARYITLWPDRVLALSLRLGTFFGTATLRPGPHFVPPEERFYAGGSNTVRGYGRNELGPGVYVGEGPVFDPDEVRFSPVGGTTLVVANAELRLPSPVARRLLRLAIFVDGGAVGLERIEDLDGEDFRVTPGVGVRAQTPIGPVRLDVAYNAYSPTVGPLYLPDPESGALIRVLDEFAPERKPFLRRFRFHLAVGNPF